MVVQGAVNGLSIVCVFNDPNVRQRTLDASIEAYRGDLDLDYVPVDNTAGRFRSAGAALNHGARLALHDVVVFVHQDVHLHSMERLVATGPLLDGEWGMLGASGVSADGRWLGRLRDRVEIVGVSASDPTDVDSLDEVLFVIAREQVLAEPLSEDPDLAWHAYGVEYGLRMRAAGRRVGAMDLAVTHNSLTTNLARLAEAHRRVAELHPASGPVRTTCGTVGAPPRRVRRLPVVRDHAWRARWLAYSLSAAGARRSTGLPVVLADIRHDVDALLPPNEPLSVVNLDVAGGFATYAGAPLVLPRYEREVTMSALPHADDLLAVVRDWDGERSIVITNLSEPDLREVAGALDRRTPWLLGRQEGESWLLGGPAALRLPAAWSSGRAVPLGQPAVRGAVAVR